MFNKFLSFIIPALLLMDSSFVWAANVLPSAPTNVTAIAGNGNAIVSFTPGSIGSGTLVKYWAACGVDTTHLITITGSASPLTVTGLTNGTLYYCWALTESTVGYSAWSVNSKSVTPTSVASVLPSAPTNVTATAGDGSATVTFTPGSIGSGTLVNYWAACDIVGDTVSGNSLYGNAVSLPITVTGLTNGTAYSCGGLTRSTVGDSAWSTRANPVTPTATTASVPASGTSVEFYNAGINHYFMTASPDEAVALDNKPSWGWVRTCKTFDIWLTQASAPANASPVCRFFGVFSNGTVGSHFYTVDAVECANVKGRLDWGWGYENNAFYAVKPVGITCQSGTSPVYRVYNNGMGGAPNHRYMANQADVGTMTSQGWVSEGVAMCAPSGTSSGGTTSCGGGGGVTNTVTLLSPANGATNQSIAPTLNWSATGSPSGYWIFVATDQNTLSGLTTAATTCSGCVIAASTGTTASYTSSSGALLSGTKYYWMIRSSLSVLSGIGSFTTTAASSVAYGKFDAKLFTNNIVMGEIKIANFPIMLMPYLLLLVDNPDQMVGSVATANPDIAKKIANGIQFDFGNGYYIPGGNRLQGSLSTTYSNIIKATSINYALSFTNFDANYNYLADGALSGTTTIVGNDVTSKIAGTLHSSTENVNVTGNIQYVASDNCKNGYPTAGSIDFVSSSKKEKITFNKKCDGTYDYVTY